MNLFKLESVARKPVLITIGVGLVLALVIGLGLFREVAIARFLANLPEPEHAVAVTVAAEDHWEQTIPAIGTLEAEQGVLVSSAVGGLVKAIRVSSGASVKADDTLVELDADVERANLRSAEAKVTLQRLTVQRLRSLRKVDAASQANLDEAEANLNSVTANAESLRATIERKVIRAPFDGDLGLVRPDLGQYVQPGDALVNLQNLSAMRLNAGVEQDILPLLKIGQAVHASVVAYPGQVFEGILSAMEPSVDGSGLVRIQASFSNIDRKLRPGMFARIEISRGQSEAVVTLPVTAVTYSLYGETVYKVEDDGSGVLRSVPTVVRIGERRDGRVRILEGIKAGDRVVAVGGFKLSRGARIKIVDDGRLSSPPVLGLD